MAQACLAASIRNRKTRQLVTAVRWRSYTNHIATPTTATTSNPQKSFVFINAKNVAILFFRWLAIPNRITGNGQRSQRYDHSVGIRPQNTMGTRAKLRKPCDATSADFTMRKKLCDMKLQWSLLGAGNCDQALCFATGILRKQAQGALRRWV